MVANKRMGIDDLISRLPNRQREACELVYSRGMRQKRAAEIMNVSPVAIHRLIWRANDRLMRLGLGTLPVPERRKHEVRNISPSLARNL